MLLMLLQSQGAAPPVPDASGGSWGDILNRPRRRLRLPSLSVTHSSRVACLMPRIRQRVSVHQVHVAFAAMAPLHLAVRSPAAMHVRQAEAPASAARPIIRFQAMLPVVGPMRVGGPAPISDAEAVAALLLWRRRNR